MPDRKGRLTPDEIREAADRAMGLSGGAGMPSKQQINQSLKMMRSPMPAYQEGGVTGRSLPPATELESVEVVQGGEPRSEEEIRREVLLELQRDNPEMFRRDVFPDPTTLQSVSTVPGGQFLSEEQIRAKVLLELQRDDPEAYERQQRARQVARRFGIDPTEHKPESEEDRERRIRTEAARRFGINPPGEEQMQASETSSPSLSKAYHSAVERHRGRMGSHLQTPTDVELMQAMDPGELPQEQSRGMDQLNEQELMLARDIAARKISQATSRMAEQGISRDASMQAQMDRQQATDELQRIMDEMSRRGVGAAPAAGGGFYDQPFAEAASQYRSELLGESPFTHSEPAPAPAPAAGGGDTSRFMERDPIMAYRGGGMAGMGAYEEGGMTGSKKNLSLRDENILATAEVLYADFRGQDVTEEDKRAAYTRMYEARDKQARADPLFAEALKTRDDPSYTPTSPFFRPGQPSIEELESGPGSIATFAEYSKWAKGELDRLAKGGARTRSADYYWGSTPTSEEHLPQAYENFVDRRIKNIQMKDISDEAGQMVDAMLGKNQSDFDQPTEDIGGISAYRYGGMTGSKKKINKYAEGGLAPRIVGETGPEIALVGEEGPELVMTAKQTRDLLAILGQPGEMSEIKSVPIAAYDEGGVAGTDRRQLTYAEIVQSLQTDQPHEMGPLTQDLYNEETRAFDLSEDDIGSMVRRAAPQGGDLDTGSLQSLVSELRAAEPESALAYDPSVGEMLLATTAETLGNPYVTGALTVASVLPGGAVARTGAAGLRTVAAKEVAEQAATRTAARTGASSAARTGLPRVMPAGSVPPVRPLPRVMPAGSVPPVRPVQTVDDATNALATLSSGQQTAVQQNLRQRLASEGVEDLTDAEFAALVRAATERRLASSGPTNLGQVLDDVPNILSNSRIANALIGAVDDVVRVANPTYGRLATGSALLGVATGQYPGQESIFSSYTEPVLAQAFQRQREEEDFLARDQAMGELSIAMDRYGRDSDNIEAFTTYGGAATTMQSALNRIERKMERGTPLTAIEEATLRDPRSVLYLYQTYGTLRGQTAQDIIANINAGGRGTGARDVELQQQRVLYPDLYEQ